MKYNPVKEAILKIVTKVNKQNQPPKLEKGNKFSDLRS